MLVRVLPKRMECRNSNRSGSKLSPSRLMHGARALQGGPSSLPLSRVQLFYLFTTLRVRVPLRTTLRALSRMVTQGKKAFAPIKFSNIWA
jgi:hypothetical protein